MKNAILMHGSCDKEEYFNDMDPSLSNAHWFPWLQKQLLKNEIFCQTPEMPDAYAPDYLKWKKEFERFDVNEESVLVGHSCGGGFLLRWLTENEVKINKLILVAPWLDPEKSQTIDFFDFKIDKKLLSRIDQAHLLVSKDDDTDIHDSVGTIKEKLPNITIHEFEDKGHFTTGSNSEMTRFQYILDLILK